MTKKTKRNPQDSTLRNVRAANKRISELELRVSRLEFENEAEKEQLKKIMKYFQDYFIKRAK